MREREREEERGIEEEAVAGGEWCILAWIASQFIEGKFVFLG